MKIEDLLTYSVEIEAFGRSIGVAYEGSLLIEDITPEEAREIIEALEEGRIRRLQPVKGQDNE